MCSRQTSLMNHVRSMVSFFTLFILAQSSLADCAEPLLKPELWAKQNAFVHVDGGNAEITSRLESLIRDQSAVYLKTKKTEDRPVLVLDLDDTLYQAAWRLLDADQQWARQNHNPEFQPYADVFLKLTPEQMPYDEEQALEAAGFDLDSDKSKAVMDDLLSHVDPIYYSNDHLYRLDRQTPGALAFTLRMRDAGAKIVYVTGRPEDITGEGTRHRLVEDGFPMDADTRLIMKPNLKTKTAEFKISVANTLRSLGKVMANIDNEPSNVINLQKAFPDAMAVFFDTKYSSKKLPITSGIYRMTGF